MELTSQESNQTEEEIIPKVEVDDVGDVVDDEGGDDDDGNVDDDDGGDDDDLANAATASFAISNDNIGSDTDTTATSAVVLDTSTIDDDVRVVNSTVTSGESNIPLELLALPNETDLPSTSNKIDGATNMILFDNEEDYENLELNFDDLYVDSEAEEEYFVQQSPIVLQYGVEGSQQQEKQQVDSTIMATATDYDEMIENNYYYQLESFNNNNPYDNSLDTNVLRLPAMKDSNEPLGAPEDGSNINDSSFSNNMADTTAAGSNVAGISGTTTSTTTATKQSVEDEYSSCVDATYILGTLIVRVAAARGLASVHDHSNSNSNNNSKYQRRRDRKNRSAGGSGGGFRFPFTDRGNNDDIDVGTNPYASVRFSTLAEDAGVDDRSMLLFQSHNRRVRQLNEQQVQRTSTVHNTCNPVWPRGENMYMDVSHPMPSKPLPKSTKILIPSGTNEENNVADTSTNTASVKSEPSLTSASNQQISNDRHPGDPPLKAATATAKASAQAAAKERILRSLDSKSSDSNRNVQPLSVEGDSIKKPTSSVRTVLSPLLSCAIFHAPNGGNAKKLFNDDNDEITKQKKFNKNNSGNNGATHGDSDDLFLGMASIDVTPLLTGKVPTIDEWIILAGGLSSDVQSSGGGNHNNNNAKHQNRWGVASVRIICEYEPTDTKPQIGDFVQFTQFCHPADLYPLMTTNSSLYKVEEVYGDHHNKSSYHVNDDENYVLISTAPTSSGSSRHDGWVSTFLAHRYMLILCKEREPTVLESCRNEIATVAERVSHSPLVQVVQETVNVRVPEDGLINVGREAVQNAVSTIFSRWIQNHDNNGIQTFIQDLNYITNWDGQHSTAGAGRNNIGNNTSMSSGGNLSGDESTLDISDYEITNSDNTADLNSKTAINVLESIRDDDRKLQAVVSSALTLPNMPSCPITGVPMRDPVVAADGHTYERTAIARWLQSNDRSPLTGSKLAHKDLVPNYMLLSSLQELATAATATSIQSLKQVPSGVSKVTPAASVTAPQNDVDVTRVNVSSIGSDAIQLAVPVAMPVPVYDQLNLNASTDPNSTSSLGAINNPSTMQSTMGENVRDQVNDNHDEEKDTTEVNIDDD